MRLRQPSALKLFAAAVVASLLTVGCAHHDPTMNRPADESVRAESDSVDGIARSVTAAPDAAAEADALRRLHRYAADHGLTYTVRTVRVADNVEIKSASVGGQQVTALVTLFHGRDVVRTFSFVPRDNRNLALLGE